MGYHPLQFYSFIKEVLQEEANPLPYHPTAAILLCMTAAHESFNGACLKQLESGIAKGAFQMEGETHDCLWSNYIKFRSKYLNYVCSTAMTLTASELVWNLKYATVMARLHYWRVTDPLPTYDGDFDEYLMELSKYAKAHYNTEGGAAKEDSYYRDFKEYYSSVLGLMEDELKGVSDD